MMDFVSLLGNFYKRFSQKILIVCYSDKKYGLNQKIFGIKNR